MDEIYGWMCGIYNNYASTVYYNEVQRNLKTSQCTVGMANCGHII